MSILTATEKAEEYINSFMEKNEDSEDFGPAISNSQLSSTIVLYEEMLQSENGSICQFGSNACGFTSYHYYKKNDKIYLIECYIQQIQRYYIVNEKWLLKQKEYLERVE
tara:strand:- start:849 stop:1175 length:327 start_codon:yes stop_codon:yes gene_type:complete